MKKKEKNKNIKHFLYEDSKKDTFLNPTRIEHLEIWRKIYDLSFREVVTAMQKYYESVTYRGLVGLFAKMNHISLEHKPYRKHGAITKKSRIL